MRGNACVWTQVNYLREQLTICASESHAALAAAFDKIKRLEVSGMLQ